jgi:hypothetical protein
MRRAHTAFLLALLVAGVPAAARAQNAAAPDTARPGDLLERLQRDDQGFYPEEALDFDRSLADSGLAALDSLGFKTFAWESTRRRRALGLELGPGDALIGYNRVEGPVPALGATVRTPLGFGTSLALQAGYATASERFRHYESLTVPVTPARRGPELALGFADRVVPYGSNRPTANALRALIGSADDRDYLERRGGWGGVTWEGSPAGAVRVRYEASKEISVAAHTDFGIFGDSRLMSVNAGIDQGIDRAVEMRVERGSLMDGHVRGVLSERVAGGALGGDFTYARLDAEAGVRRYLWFDHELVLEAGYARTGGAPPVQRLADVGGLSTVRGFDRRTRVGREAAHARAELLLPYDVFAASRFPLLRDARIQLVPWADAGRVWRGNADGWLTSAGLGLQRYLGPFGEGSYLRLDAAVPFGPDRPGDVRFYLRFARGLF